LHKQIACERVANTNTDAARRDAKTTKAKAEAEKREENHWARRKIAALQLEYEL